MRWSKFKNRDSREIFEIVGQKVFPFIKNLSGENESAFSRYMGSAMFLILTPQVLQKIITGLDDIYEHDIATSDMQGDLYEYMLNKLSQSGTNGQFRTPSHIIKMMVALLDPKPDDRICESKTQNLIQINDCPLRGVAYDLGVLVLQTGAFLYIGDVDMAMITKKLKV